MAPCLLGELQRISNVNTRVHMQVQFSEPVSTTDHPKINEWLSLVEGQMRFTLASSLAQAVQDIKQFKDGAIDREAYMNWCDKYQVVFLHRFVSAFLSSHHNECVFTSHKTPLLNCSVVIAGSDRGPGSSDSVERRC
jgi:hypothetical protein